MLTPPSNCMTQRRCVRVLVQQGSGCWYSRGQGVGTAGSARAAAVARGRLNPWHATYLATFEAVGMHRRMAHASMLPQQVRLELVVGNFSVADATTGGLIASQNSLPATVQPREAGVTLGQISSSLTYQPAVNQLVMPAAWQQKLQEAVTAGVSRRALAGGHTAALGHAVRGGRQHLVRVAGRWQLGVPAGSSRPPVRHRLCAVLHGVYHERRAQVVLAWVPRVGSMC
jgi:hypothetical protein